MTIPILQPAPSRPRQARPPHVRLRGSALLGEVRVLVREREGPGR